jgi:large subunit ribosomal protein L18
MKNRLEYLAARHRRVRRKVFGTAQRPRMSIKITGRYMYVQFIDDEQGRTLAWASSQKSGERNNVAGARKLGQLAAQSARDAGIREVVVDRGGHRFHGRVRAIVEELAAARLVPGAAPAAGGEENKEQ